MPDEGTGALDTRHAILVIVYRLSAIRGIEQSLVLDVGRVVVRGTHVELPGAGGFCAMLHEMQVGADQDAFNARDLSAS